MRLAQLKYLSALADAKSITGAAKSLYISQPALSEAIKDLEEEVGYEIITRTNKGIVFTQLGEMALEKAKIVLNIVDEIQNLGTKQNKSLTKLFIGGVPYAFDTFLLDVIINLQEKYPDFKILLSENSSFDLLKDMSSNKLNLAIILMCNEDADALEKDMRAKGLETINLFSQEMCFWVGPKNPLANQSSTTMEGILQYPLVYYKGNFNQYTRKFLGDFVPANELKLIKIDDRESVKKYVFKSKSTVIMPRHCDNSNYLIPLVAENCPMKADICIVKSQNRPLSLEEKIFIEELKMTVNTLFLSDSN